MARSQRGNSYTPTVQAVYYRDQSGKEPVNDFIDELAPERQEELDFKISLLNRTANSDPPLPFPHSSQIEGQLRECVATTDETSIGSCTNAPEISSCSSTPSRSAQAPCHRPTLMSRSSGSTTSRHG